jgi:hypothetical protein
VQSRFDLPLDGNRTVKQAVPRGLARRLLGKQSHPISFAQGAHRSPKRLALSEHRDAIRADCPVSAALTEADRTQLTKLSAEKMKELVCEGDNNALNILRGFLNDGYIKDTGAQAPGLVDAILKPECPVFAALTEEDKASLNRLAKEASGAH